MLRWVTRWASSTPSATSPWPTRLARRRWSRTSLRRSGSGSTASIGWPPATKQEAKAKLAVLKVGVGYPDKWPTYSGLEIVGGDAYGNIERSRLYEYRRAVGKLGRPVDRTEWVMTPQTVNA